jgi:hypothetical protein
MRLFVAPVASVAFSRQKVGNASDALPKDGSNLQRFATLKKRNKKRHFSAKGKTSQNITF